MYSLLCFALTRTLFADAVLVVFGVGTEYSISGVYTSGDSIGTAPGVFLHGVSYASSVWLLLWLALLVAWSRRARGFVSVAVSLFASAAPILGFGAGVGVP